MRHLFSTKLRIILVVAVLLSAALAVAAGVTNQTLPGMIVQGVLAPFKSALNSLTSLAEQYYSYMFRYESLAAENQKLKADMAQMEDVARQADAVSRENQRLREMLNLQSTHESYNMVAITENGQVVGLVTEAGPNYAVVKTVLDSTLEISATIASSGYNGMVSGGYINGQETLLQMNDLPSSSIIRNKDQVVTSGSTVYPRGLILGYVVDAGFEETGVAKYALLQAAADISSLEQVFILTDYTTEVESAGAAAPTEATTPTNP